MPGIAASAGPLQDYRSLAVALTARAVGEEVTTADLDARENFEIVSTASVCPASEPAATVAGSRSRCCLSE
jgi:hypothetical protein